MDLGNVFDYIIICVILEYYLEILKNKTRRKIWENVVSKYSISMLHN